MRAYRWRIAAVLALALVFPATAAADTDKFGRLFPQLPALNSQTNQQLADLAQSMLDPNADTENNCAAGATTIAQCDGSWVTYFGQFLDHDLTLDRSPSPTAPVDPTTLTNFRTFRFDLDSVYGDGPAGSPQLYMPDGLHFKIQEPNENGVRDLPRNPDGSAILVEPRNDENQVLAQIHVVFLKLHNRLIDEGLTFADARRTLTMYYQHAIVEDYLPHIIGHPVTGNESGRLHNGMTPVEFSVAAFRFGHSQVRRAYELTDSTGKLQVFSFTNPAASLMGGRPIQAGREIEWGNFFAELEESNAAVVNGTPDPAAHFNISRKIDTLISSSLFQLPIPGAEAEGANVLAFRNMVRAKFYDMPSGQAVARAMGVPVLTDAELALPASVAPAFQETCTKDGAVEVTEAVESEDSAAAARCSGGVPLWYYVLRESSVRENGERLGPVGSRIVYETFLGVLDRDPDSIFRHGKDFVPDPEVTGPDGVVNVSDAFVFAGVAAPPDEG